MKRRIIVLGLTLALCFGMFAGCGLGNKKVGEDDLIVWASSTYWGGTNETLVNEMLDLYEQESGKNVIFIPQADLDTKLKSATGSDVPDIVFWDRWDSVKYIKEGQFVDLTPLMARDGIDASDYQSQAMGELTYNNKYYGLPLDVDMWGIFVNTKMLAAAGINKLPETWDEFRTAAIAMTVGSGSSMTRAGFLADISLSFYSWMLTSGGEMLNSNMTATAFNSAYGEAVLSFMYDLIYIDGVFDPIVGMTQGGPSDDVFLKGKVAMITNSLLNGTSFYNQYKSDDFEFEFIPFPKGPSSAFAVSTGETAGTNAGGLLGGYGLTIPTKSSKTESAWDLIKWWVTNTDNALKWAEISNLIPAKLDVMEREEVKDIPNVRNVIDSVEYYRTRPTIVSYPNLESGVTIPEVYALLLKTKYTDNGRYPTTIDKVRACLNEMQSAGDDLLAFYA